MAAPLVTVGDSLTQGFQHGAIHRTSWSYPAMVARALGVQSFRQPDFLGDGFGGPLLDLEVVSGALAERFGASLHLWEVPAALLKLRSLMDRVEDFWERGNGTTSSSTGPLHHNLAVWGFEVLDALTLSDGVCLRNMPPAKDDFISQIPEFGMYRTARRVLNPSQQVSLEELTQLDVAEKIAKQEGGIENLIVALGANNALATCLMLELRWSQSADFRKLAHQRNVTIWEPAHFALIYDQLVARVKSIAPERVFLATVPHVTIAPVARGVSPLAKKRNSPQRIGGYYEYYTHFWIWDDDFDPHADPRITREDARAVDSAIDEYNARITAVALENGWNVIDFSKVLDDLAFRRNDGAPRYSLPDGLIVALASNPKTAFRVRPDGTVLLDTRYLRLPKTAPASDAPSDSWQAAYEGGLFGLDGVHPTTIGYGIMAHEVLKSMRDAGVSNADPAALPWNDIVAADTLVTAPPAILSSLEDSLSFLFGKAKLDRLIQKLSGYGSQPFA